MDVRNLKIIVYNVGDANLFCIQHLNDCFTHELEHGKSPSTLLSRISSLKRFILYLKIYYRNMLPQSQEIELLVSELRGLEVSLSKQKLKRQRFIMSNNRNQYHNTVQVLRDWRNNRKSDESLLLFRQFLQNTQKQLSNDDFIQLRNFLIVELLIANGQRPGVICGMLICEVNSAKLITTKEGYHKLIVENHKTGYLQHATLFIYPEIFHALFFFICRILPKLPVYSNFQRRLTKNSHVFQTLNGEALFSSKITPIVRDYLAQTGLHFTGTITDIRKAAATLTGTFAPDLHELMALFLCHSRKSHDKYYRINMGHNGLSEAFQMLESFQTEPFIDSSKTNDSLVENCQSHTSMDSQNHSPISSLQNTPMKEFCSQQISRGNFIHDQQPTLSSIHSTRSLHVDENYIECEDESIDISFRETYRCKSFESNISDLDHIPLSHNSVSLEEICHTSHTRVSEFESANISPCPPQHSTPKSHNRQFDTKTQTLSSSDNHSCSSRKDILDEVPNFTFNRSSMVSLKSFDICIVKLDISAAKYTRNISDGTSAIYVGNPDHLNSKKLFLSLKSELIFNDVFSDHVLRIANRRTVTKREIVSSLNQSAKFQPVLLQLRERFSDDIIYIKIVNKVRTRGNLTRTKSIGYDVELDSCKELFANMSANTIEGLRKKTRTKSIFNFRKDEVIFRKVFADLINKVSDHQYLSRQDILDRINDPDFQETFVKLKNQFSNDVYGKIISKVRTVGLSRRKK